MKILLDTHILLWVAYGEHQLSSEARAILTQPNAVRYFSVVSLWEIAIKTSLGRPHFDINVAKLRELALQNGYQELPITIDHLTALVVLPWLHKDPFDRLLVAQSQVEGLTLLTSDHMLGAYGGNVIEA